MTDPISDDARDDFILRERLSGRSERSIGRELHCGVSDVSAALDRVLPKLDQAALLRQISLDLNRLEGLLETFYKRAIEKKCTQSALCVVKILERKSALIGTDSAVKIDILQMTATKQISSFEQMKEIVWRIGHPDRPMPKDWGNMPNGPDGPEDDEGDGDGKLSN